MVELADTHLEGGAERRGVQIPLPHIVLIPAKYLYVVQEVGIFESGAARTDFVQYYSIIVIHVIVCFFRLRSCCAERQERRSGGGFCGQGSQTGVRPRARLRLFSRATTWSAIMFMITSILLFDFRGTARWPKSVFSDVKPPQTKSQPATRLRLLRRQFRRTGAHAEVGWPCYPRAFSGAADPSLPSGYTLLFKQNLSNQEGILFPFFPIVVRWPWPGITNRSHFGRSGRTRSRRERIIFSNDPPGKIGATYAAREIECPGDQ